MDSGASAAVSPKIWSWSFCIVFKILKSALLFKSLLELPLSTRRGLASVSKLHSFGLHQAFFAVTWNSVILPSDMSWFLETDLSMDLKRYLYHFLELPCSPLVGWNWLCPLLKYESWKLDMEVDITKPAPWMQIGSGDLLKVRKFALWLFKCLLQSWSHL